MKEKIKSLIFKTIWAFNFAFSIPWGIYLASNPILTKLAEINSSNNLGKEKTAILVSYCNSTDKFRRYASEIGPTAYYFSKKSQIEIIDEAKQKDLERVLADTTYKNIVLNGHGSTGTWEDSNGKSVKYSKLKNLKEKEIILQLTCGGGNKKSLVELCAKNKNKSFYPTKSQNSLQAYYQGMKLLFSK